MSAQAPRFPFHFQQALAGPHKNFHYVVGDPATRQAALIDPAFEVGQLISDAKKQGFEVKRALFTHGHWDHIGGIPAIVQLGVEQIHIHEAARDHPKLEEALDAGASVGLAADGHIIAVGDLSIQWLHTPGHQPEASCFLVGPGPRALFGGDTLFVGSCGRTDFPGGDTDAMFSSMGRLRSLASPDTYVMPGHHYGQEATRSLADEVRDNAALATTHRDAFERLPFLRD